MPLSKLSIPTQRTSAQRDFALLLAAANVGFALAIGWPLFETAKAGLREGQWLAALLPYVANTILLCALVAALLLVVGRLLGGRALLPTGVALFWLLQIFLLFDSRLYGILAFHANKLVWSVLTTDGGFDSVVLGTQTYLSVALLFVSLLLLVFGAAVAASAVVAKQGPAGLFERWPRAVRLLLLGALLLVVLDKGRYGYAELTGNSAITQVSKPYSLYLPLPAAALARALFGYEPPGASWIELGPSTGALDYPHQPLQRTTKAGDPDLPNILFLIVDSLRPEVLREQSMPNTAAFAQQSIRFDQHYSGGNFTQLGLFSIFYGLHGNYWEAFLQARRSPVFFDTLLALNYETRIWSSTQLSFPRFRDNIFVRVADHIEDRVASGESWQKDRIITDRLLNFLGKRDGAQPFFAMAFYDSPHLRFSYPPPYEKFTPATASSFNYVTDLGVKNVELLHNRYLNAVWYVDHLLGEVYGALAQQQLLDNTIVLFASDHGIEFYEHGRLAYLSNFADTQTRTLAVLRIPGEAPRAVTHRTSHLDLAPTLLELLGVTSDASSYSQGSSLLKAPERRSASVAGFESAGLITDSARVVYEVANGRMCNFEVRDNATYRLLPEQRSLLEQLRPQLLQERERLVEFLR